MNDKVSKVISSLSLEEKASLCSGLDFWHTKAVGEVPSVMLSDGPQGLRKQDTDNPDALGVNDSIVSVCFPAACAAAASFDTELLLNIGEALGEECASENVAVLLAPAVNIKRSPLCGRNFEYFSEDPFLAGKLAAAYIKGLQKNGTAAALKHFACNNCENGRMTVSSEVDERALREIYLTPFEIAVKDGKTKTVMCSYNKINGEYASENHRLLTEILRDEWGFEGFVMSDWYAVNDRVKGLLAGLELEMPSSGGITDEEIVKAVKDGKIDESVLDTAVARLLNVILEYKNEGVKTDYLSKHHSLAVDFAERCMVLLKNNGVLPLKSGAKTAFIGELAQKPRIEGGGSSHVRAYKEESLLDLCENPFALGYRLDEEEPDEKLIDEAVSLASGCDCAVVFAGLPDGVESEGYDRENLSLPACQNELISRLSKVQKNLVVVLFNGAPVEMPWINEVSGVIEAYLSGEGTAQALVNILYGIANPCAKLPESFPLKLEDNPSFLSFASENKKVNYAEGIYVGYRYYTKKKQKVLFPFGYGLSYTQFEFSGLSLPDTVPANEITEVRVNVKNVGKVKGRAVAELYISDKTGNLSRPVRELKGFKSVLLEPDEEKTVSIFLDKRSFAYYNTQTAGFVAESGAYAVEIGNSCEDIVLSKDIILQSDDVLPFKVDLNTTVGEILKNDKLKETALMLFESYIKAEDDNESEAITARMQMKMIEGMPLRALRTQGAMTTEQVSAFVDMFNSML